jgi:hypothetical protein
MGIFAGVDGAFSLLLSLQSTLPNFDGAASIVRQKREGQDLNLICIS